MIYHVPMLHLLIRLKREYPLILRPTIKGRKKRDTVSNSKRQYNQITQPKRYNYSKLLFHYSSVFLMSSTSTGVNTPSRASFGLAPIKSGSWVMKEPIPLASSYLDKPHTAKHDKGQSEGLRSAHAENFTPPPPDASSRRGYNGSSKQRFY